jgi:hypothetical protein
MKAVNIALAGPRAVRGALVAGARGPRDRSLTENAIAFYMYVILDI